ncbi:MAG: autotransporter assembly complex family protein [Pseudomonadota bacterium]|nr:autotransporter assembly complex family protein [Pseudomonadota bacterium]
MKEPLHINHMPTRASVLSLHMALNYSRSLLLVSPLLIPIWAYANPEDSADMSVVSTVSVVQPEQYLAVPMAEPEVIQPAVPADVLMTTDVSVDDEIAQAKRSIAAAEAARSGQVDLSNQAELLPIAPAVPNVQPDNQAHTDQNQSAETPEISDRIPTVEAEAETSEAPLIDLEFPDLEAELPPLELVDEPPIDTPSPEQVTAEPSKNLFQRIKGWFGGKTDEAFAPEPTISVNIQNAPESLAKNLEAALTRVTVDEFSEFQDSLPRLRSLARDAAQAVGYYDSQFIFSQAARDVLNVAVTAGEPVIVQSQNIQILGDAEEMRRFQRIQENPDLAVGDILNHERYEQTKARISSSALERGYFDGKWASHEVLVTLPDRTADIDLVYDSGERYRFGEVSFGSIVPDLELPVRMKWLQSLLPFKPDDPYDARQVAQLSRQLLDTRWFNNIEVTAFTPDSLDNQDQEAVEEVHADTANRARVVPVRVLVDARQPNSAEVGLGYGTDTGVRLRGQYRRALVNDKGHSFDANLELSQIRQAIDGRYSIPYKHPLKDVVSVFGGFEREEISQIDSGFDVLSTGGTLGIERSIRPDPNDWHHTWSLRYRLDEVEIKFTDPELRQSLSELEIPVDNLKLTQQVLLGGYGISKVTSRWGVDPYQGFRQSYQVEVGSKALLSDVDLAILRAGWRAIESFGEARKHRLVGRLDLATIVTKDFEAVPYNLRFFAGGDQSIRGYDYKSLSTVRDDGELSGGQNLAVGSIEYNYEFFPKWRGAIFVDAGNAFDQGFTDPVKYGAGLGVRWSSPVGPIRIDVAAGVSESSMPIRLHFFIGPSL